MTVTITGATGLIGKALCQVLSERGIAYRALVRTKERAEAVRGAESVVIGSAADPDAVAAACEGSAAVVHLARSTHSLADLCRSDYPALHAVIAAVNANAAELHFVSTQMVFGDAPYPIPVVDDDSPTRPSTAYGAMKAAWEWTARAACTVSPVIYRVPVAIPAAIADGAPWLQELLAFGFCHIDSGSASLELRPRQARFARAGFSFVHVEDIAQAIAANLFRPQARGTVALLADPVYVGFRDLAEFYARIARARGFQVHDAWSGLGSSFEVAGAMYRFGASRGAANLGFVSENGEARLKAKLAEWFSGKLQ